MNPGKVSIVIPVYNESRCLETKVGLVDRYLASIDVDYEILLVDDGSTDMSGLIGQKLEKEMPRLRTIGYPENRGKGFAVRTGMLDASGTHIVFMDADLAVPLPFVKTFLECLASGDTMVMASRHVVGAEVKVREGTVREFMGGAYRVLVRSLLGLRVTDVTCGMKGFSAPAAQIIFGRSRI